MAVFSGGRSVDQAFGYESSPAGGMVEVIPGFLDFRYVRNFRAAFGMMEGKTWFFLIVTSLICIALIIGLFWYKKHNWLSYTACIFKLWRGVGNLIDRISMKGILSRIIFMSLFFPHVQFCRYLVTLGTIGMVIYVIFFTRKRKSKERRSRNERQIGKRRTGEAILITIDEEQAGQRLDKIVSCSEIDETVLYRSGWNEAT